MLKKYLLFIFLSVTIIFLGSCSETKAYNHDVGIYPESGLRGYLVTDSLSYFKGGFHCTVVCYPNGKPYYIYYTFKSDYAGFYFTNSDGFTHQVHKYYTPVEYNVWRYAW